MCPRILLAIPNVTILQAVAWQVLRGLSHPSIAVGEAGAY